MSRKDWADLPEDLVVITYLGDTDDHVGDSRFERVDSAGLFHTAEPDANTDEKTIPLLGRLSHFLELTGDVGEVLGNLTTLALDDNFPCIYCACNCEKKRKHG